MISDVSIVIVVGIMTLIISEQYTNRISIRQTTTVTWRKHDMKCTAATLKLHFDTHHVAVFEISKSNFRKIPNNLDVIFEKSPQKLTKKLN